MNRPRNFEKIDHKHFVEDAIEYEISLNGYGGVWIIPTDAYKSQFKNVILLDMMWDKNVSGLVTTNFCTINAGTQVAASTTTTIKDTDLYRMQDYIDWCRRMVKTFQNKLKK